MTCPVGPAGSYSPDLTGRTFLEEVERLRRQVERSWHVEHRRLEALGVAADGGPLLEAGCGPGFITERLSSWMPGRTIVGTDVDAAMLDVARRTVGGRPNVRLLRSSVTSAGLAPATFDVALSRYLFQHLPDPADAARGIRRLLRPGGLHVVIDVDDSLWGIAAPEMPAFREWHRVRGAGQAARGGSRVRGRHLGRLLREAGYVNVTLDVFAYDSDEVGLAAFDEHLDGDQFLSMLEEGRMSEDDYLRSRAMLHRFRQQEGAFILAVGFIACGEAP